MMRRLVSLSYCIVFIIAFVSPFSTNSTEWHDEEESGMKFWGDGLDVMSDLMKLGIKFIPDKSGNVDRFVKTILGVKHILNKILKNLHKIDKTKTYFMEIKRQLNEQMEQVQVIQQAIKNLGMIAGYSESEREILHGLKTLQQYLENPQDEHLLKAFYDQSNKLPRYLDNLLDGLLGRKNFNADIMSILRDFNKCHSQKLQEQVEQIMKFIEAGFAVHFTYQELANVSPAARLNIQKSIVESTLNVTTRLDEMVRKCQEDESNIEDKMKDIIENHPLGQNPPAKFSQKLRDDLKIKLLDFLTEKYYTKMWNVFVLKFKEAYLLSRGFHKVVDLVAGAISVEDSTELRSMANIFLEDFKLPFQTKARFPGSIRGYSMEHPPITGFEDEIQIYLDSYLELMRRRVDTETLIVREDKCDVIDCNYSDVNLPYTTFTSSIGNTAVMIIIVPVKLSISFRNSSMSDALNSTTKILHDQCGWNSSGSGPLRNHDTDLYLYSVEHESTAEGAYIIADRWKNRPNQKWWFVNDQLRNDNDKCLTAYKQSDTHLRQYDCHPKWIGQKWYRNGLQIINGYNLCLFHDETKKGDYIIQDSCFKKKSYWERPEHWHVFHPVCVTDLKSPMAEHNYQGYELIRMRNRNLYLTALHNHSESVQLKTWTNYPGQYWKLDHGKLMNANGKCLIFCDDSWKVKLTDCNEIKNGQRLSHNDNNQIVSDTGYCLSFSNPDGGGHHYDRCRSDAPQGWIFNF